MAATVQPEYKNYVSRALDGVPSRPATATPEMIAVAERVINLMVESGHAHGYFGDRGNEFVTDQVNWLLRDFVAFAQTGEKAEYAKVDCNVMVLNSRRMKTYDPDVIKKYANFSG
ncbi:MAG TPA: hypothetical protein VIJ14_08830, partial [Rhabdochlamydiaceae bacterium]